MITDCTPPPCCACLADLLPRRVLLYEQYLAHKKKGAENEYFSLGDHLDVQGNDIYNLLIWPTKGAEHALVSSPAIELALTRMPMFSS